jgi:hypothetical protein
MRFEASGRYVNGVADVDPIAAPATVSPEHILSLLRRQNDCDVDGRRILLILEAPAAETLTVELWALDDATDPPVFGDVAELSTRRWYLFTPAPIVVTGSRMIEVTAIVPAGGKVFARRTADTLTTTRVLKASCVA